MAEKIVVADTMEQVINLFGNFDSNVKIIEQELDIKIASMGTDLKISGNNAAQGERVIRNLLKMAANGETIEEQNVRYVIGSVKDGDKSDLSKIYEQCICITAKGKPIKPKTAGQKKYADDIINNTITIGVGPAGTGKTYLAVAIAVSALRKKEVNKIILTRPAVEAGEKLGYLPGDLQSKVDPYLRPLYDGLLDMLGSETYMKYLERGVIEIAPLAYMRGRTLDESFIILDEAQNTTPEQMKMFLTRIGFGSKAVVTGDVTQIDLPGAVTSGLKEAVRVLKGIDDIAIDQLSERDVVRHPLVQKIIKAYEKYDLHKSVVNKKQRTSHEGKN